MNKKLLLAVTSLFLCAQTEMSASMALRTGNRLMQQSGLLARINKNVLSRPLPHIDTQNIHSPIPTLQSSHSEHSSRTIINPLHNSNGSRNNHSFFQSLWGLSLLPPFLWSLVNDPANCNAADDNCCNTFMFINSHSFLKHQRTEFEQLSNIDYQRIIFDSTDLNSKFFFNFYYEISHYYRHDKKSTSACITKILRALLFISENQSARSLLLNDDTFFGLEWYFIDKLTPEDHKALLNELLTQYEYCNDFLDTKTLNVLIEALLKKREPHNILHPHETLDKKIIAFLKNIRKNKLSHTSKIALINLLSPTTKASFLSKLYAESEPQNHFTLDYHTFDKESDLIDDFIVIKGPYSSLDFEHIREDVIEEIHARFEAFKKGERPRLTSLILKQAGFLKETPDELFSTFIKNIFFSYINKNSLYIFASDIRTFLPYLSDLPSSSDTKTILEIFFKTKQRFLGDKFFQLVKWLQSELQKHFTDDQLQTMITDSSRTLNIDQIMILISAIKNPTLKTLTLNNLPHLNYNLRDSELIFEEDVFNLFFQDRELRHLFVSKILQPGCANGKDVKLLELFFKHVSLHERKSFFIKALKNLPSRTNFSNLSPEEISCYECFLIGSPQETVDFHTRLMNIYPDYTPFFVAYALKKGFKNDSLIKTIKQSLTNSMNTSADNLKKIIVFIEAAKKLELPAKEIQPFVELQRKILSQHPFGTLQKASPPLFSSFIENHTKNIVDYMVKAESTGECNLNALCWDIADHAKKEYASDRILFFHGQSANWGLLQIFYKMLEKNYLSSTTESDSFVPLRFKKQTPLSKKEITDIRARGTSGILYEKYRYRVLFANLHLFANHHGSNSYSYILYNMDQTQNKGLDIRLSFIKEIFTSLGLEKEYVRLKEAQHTLKNIIALYDEAIAEQGNTGLLLAISMPRTVAQKLSYPSRSGGGINPISINGEKTDDVTKIADQFDEVTFDNEYCIILSEEMLDPVKAKEAGICIKSFDPTIYQRTSKYIAFENYLERVIEWLKDPELNPPLLPEQQTEFEQHLFRTM